MDNDIIFAADVPRATMSRRVSRGDAIRLAPGVYTTDTKTAPERVVQRAWRTIAGRMFPDAVITDRSIQSGGPTNGILYLAHDRRPRFVSLPGLEIEARRGAAPQDDDIPLPGGLHQASFARALAEEFRRIPGPTRENAAPDDQRRAGGLDPPSSAARNRRRAQPSPRIALGRWRRHSASRRRTSRVSTT